MQGQPLGEDPLLCELGFHQLIIFLGVQHPGLSRGRMGGIGGDDIVAPRRDLEKVTAVVGDQTPVGALQDVVILFGEQLHSVAHVRNNVYRVDRHVMLGHSAQGYATAHGIDQDGLGISLQ